MTGTQPLRAGVIGLGVGEQHIDGYQRALNTRVAGLCDSNPEKLSEVARRYPGCTLYDSAEAIIEATDIDILSIASFDHHHARQIIAALDRGKHVFCEKPLCTSEEELHDIRAALARNPGLRLSTNTVLRSSPRFEALHRSIRENELGRLYYLEADYNYGRLEKLRNGWRGEIVDYSVMLGGGVHMIDLLLWLTGRSVVEVVALGNKICSESFRFETPDMVVALLKFDDNTLAKVAANFGCVFPHFHRLVVYGTEATFENAPGPARLYRSRDPAVQPEPIDTDYPGVKKGDLIPRFVDAVRGVGKPAIEEQEVIATMAVCLAIDRSWKERRPVRLQ